MRNVIVCLNKPYWKYSNLDYYLNYIKKYPNTEIHAAKIIPPEGRYLEYECASSNNSNIKVGKCFQHYNVGGYKWWITYEDIPTELGSQMFKDSGIKSILIPEGVKNIG